MKKTHRFSQSNDENRKKKKRRIFRRRVLPLVFKVCMFFRTLFDYFVNKMFSLYYDTSKNRVVPPTNDTLLIQSANSLAQDIREGKKSCQSVVSTFITRAKEVNSYINAIVDERFDDALNEAKQIDDDIASGKISKKDFEEKPFLGIPFTTKDSTACKDMLFTFGLVSRREVKATEDADVVALMKRAGGILIATTNIPEVNMWQETRNNVFGQTCNPYNTSRTTGGSSGGEASLIASCGSPMGIGTDIGGSIRMPAFFCGVMGHKPTSDLVPTKGLTRRTGLEENSMVVAGPICRYASDLTPILKVLVGKKGSLLKLDDKVDVNNIKFFYMEESKDIRTTWISNEMRKVMYRVVNHFTDKLANKENVPVQVNFSDMKYSFRLWRHAMTKEPMNFAFELANREGEINGFYELFKKLLGKSDFTLAAIVNLLNSQLLPKENVEWAEKTLKKLREEIMETLGSNGVLLYPSYTSTAPYHYSAFFRPFNFGYWAVFNALHLPVTQVPMGLGEDGLPVGIQVVASPYNDHLCLAVAKELEEAFGGWVPIIK